MACPRPLPRFCLYLVGLLAGVSAMGQPGESPKAATYPVELQKPLTARQPLIVGVTTDSFPYGYIDNKGQSVGFSVDVLDAVARVMNLQIRRIANPGRQMQERFRQGEFDLLQILSQTADRDEFADFSVPFLTLQGTVFVQKHNNPIRRLEDFNGRKFAIIGTRSIGDKFLRDHQLQVEPVLVSSSEEALRLLDRGEVAGTFLSQLTALSVIERGDIRNVVLFDQPFPDYDIRHCYAVHKGDAILLARLNEGLAILRRTGEFDRIYRHWFGRIDSPLITREQVLNYGAALLALGFLIALTAYLRLRALHRRIAVQTAELAAQQTLLRALYDNMPLAMCVFEEVPAGGFHLLILNRQAEALLGLTQLAATNQQLSELSLEPELAGCIDDLLHKGRGIAALLREERLLPVARRHLALMLVPLLRSPDGRTRFCLLAEDTTERHHLAEEIAQSRKLRAVGELVGGIAHEFNNLLTPILLKTGEIQLDWPEDRRLNEAVGLIASTTQRAAELTRRLLTFGRKDETGAEVVHLAAAVDSCFALLRLTVDRRIQWQNDVPPGLPALYINATDLNQILINLILNSRDTLLDKIASAGSNEWSPLIRIEAVHLPPDARQQLPDAPATPLLGWEQLTVRDNGLGMTPEVKERIYEPFFTTKVVGRGTGLGLATVWHLVHVAGGRIEVDSTPGQGTAVHVFLPIGPVPASAGPAAPTLSTAPRSPARVFVAEDEDLVARTIIAILERDGHTVHREPDGAAAWRTLEAQPDQFDLLVLDVNMPGLSGIDVVQRIRATARYHGPIMIMSGRLSSNDLELLATAKVDCVMNKPFEIAGFLSSVRRCLDRLGN